MVVVGYDDYNQDITGDVTMSLTGARMDSHHVPCAVIYDARGNGEGGGGTDTDGRSSGQNNGLHGDSGYTK